VKLKVEVTVTKALGHNSTSVNWSSLIASAQRTQENARRLFATYPLRGLHGTQQTANTRVGPVFWVFMQYY